MIPSTLPAPAPDIAGGSGPQQEHPVGEGFDQALARAARRDGAPEAAGGPVAEEPGAEMEDEAPDGLADGPATAGHARALAAMPVDVPARPVLAGTAHDARPTAPEVDAPPTSPPSPDLPRTGSDGVAPGPGDVATLEGSVATPSDTDGDAVAGPDAIGPADRAEASPDEVRTAGPASSGGTADPTAARSDGPRNGAAASSHDPGNGAAASSHDPGNGAAASSDGAAASPRGDRDGATTGPGPAGHGPAQVDVVGPAVAATTVSGPPDVAATSPPPAPAPPVAEQLVAHVTPLAEGADGTHELTIELRPVELGTVRLEVTLDDGVLSVRVHADDPASRRLLAQSLGDLRHALADAGISAGSLDVGDPRGGADAGDRGATEHDQASPRGGDGPPAPRPHAPARRPLPGRSAVDVLL